MKSVKKKYLLPNELVPGAYWHFATATYVAGLDVPYLVEVFDSPDNDEYDGLYVMYMPFSVEDNKDGCECLPITEFQEFGDYFVPIGAPTLSEIVVPMPTRRNK